MTTPTPPYLDEVEGSVAMDTDGCPRSFKSDEAVANVFFFGTLVDIRPATVVDRVVVVVLCVVRCGPELLVGVAHSPPHYPPCTGHQLHEAMLEEAGVSEISHHIRPPSQAKIDS